MLIPKPPNIPKRTPSRTYKLRFNVWRIVLEREAVNVHNNPLAIDHGTEFSSPASSKEKITLE